MKASNPTDCLSVASYLTTQLQEIICMGPGHTLTWANNRQQLPLSLLVRRGRDYDWMQVSVHSGDQCYLMVQFTLPDTQGESARPRLDAIFAQYGWTSAQADGRDCLFYYIAQSTTARQLLDAAESVATRCAEVMRCLWQTRSLEDIALLGARGPRIDLPPSSARCKPGTQELRMATMIQAA